MNNTNAWLAEPMWYFKSVITIIVGTDPRISENLSINKSILPPKYPEIEPQMTPTIKFAAATTVANMNENLAPYARHAKMSLPVWVVPKRNTGSLIPSFFSCVC